MSRKGGNVFCDLKLIDFFKAKFWFQNLGLVMLHFGIVLLCILYTAAGAALFYKIEKPNEISKKEEMLRWLQNEQQTLLKVAFQLATSQNGIIWEFFR